MDKQAYRNEVFHTQIIPEAPVSEWTQLAKTLELKQLHSKKLTGKESSINAEIDKATSNWNVSDREQFRYWYRNTRAGKQTERTMIRLADYIPLETQQKLDEFSKSRESMIRRLRRLQNELGKFFEKSKRYLDWSDEQFPSAEKKFEAIQVALNQICILLGTLRTKEVTAAAIKRTATFLKTADPQVSEMFLEAIGGHRGMQRIAAESPLLEIAKKLKYELDTLHYGTHLRRCFNIYEQLLNEGYEGIAQSLEDIIQKDLSDLAKIYKRLSDTYSDLLKIPASDLSKIDRNKEEITERLEEEKTPSVPQREFKTPEMPEESASI